MDAGAGTKPVMQHMEPIMTKQKKTTTKPTRGGKPRARPAQAAAAPKNQARAAGRDVAAGRGRDHGPDRQGSGLADAQRARCDLRIAEEETQTYRRGLRHSARDREL